MGSAEGQASDIEITAKEIQKLKKELYEIIALHSGQPYKTILKDADRDYWMTAEEAKEYGMIDEILVKNKTQYNREQWQNRAKNVLSADVTRRETKMLIAGLECAYLR